MSCCRQTSRSGTALVMDCYTFAVVLGEIVAQIIWENHIPNRVYIPAQLPVVHAHCSTETCRLHRVVGKFSTCKRRAVVCNLLASWGVFLQHLRVVRWISTARLGNCNCNCRGPRGGCFSCRRGAGGCRICQRSVFKVFARLRDECYVDTSV